MIDTHQHLLYPNRFNYDWAADIPALHGALTLEEYRKAAAGCGIEGTVFMEVDVAEQQGVDEARFFCSLACEAGSGILGVIAAGRPESDGFERQLDAIAHPRLKGLRRVLHTQPDELSQSWRFREHIARLAGRSLSFDICVLQRQLPLAIELVKACPETTFILDHCGVPDIAGNDAPTGNGWRYWKRQIESLAEFPMVNCKISGILLYASESQRNAEGLRPYVEAVIEAFGWDRVVWGGDWPVCSLGGTLQQWTSLTGEILAGETGENWEKLYTLNARRLYKL